MKGINSITIMKGITTIHLVGSAHIYPVWYWRQSSGIVEVPSTCRIAADLIEEYNDSIFTQSDVWVYDIIEKYDHELFQKIKQYIKKGR